MHHISHVILEVGTPSAAPHEGLLGEATERGDNKGRYEVDQMGVKTFLSYCWLALIQTNSSRPTK